MIDELLGDTAALLYGRHAAGTATIGGSQQIFGRHRAPKQHAFIRHLENDEWGCSHYDHALGGRCFYPRSAHPTMAVA